MKTNLMKEVPLLLLVAAPFIYLGVIWSSIPAQIPMQYDLHGNVTRSGEKSELIMLCFMLPGLMYLILLLVPLIDPKGKIKKMGSKYYHFKLWMLIFMSALAVFMIYTSAKNEHTPPNGALALIGIFLAVMGNYFQSIQPNYFIGIRTPWTLENETVWRATHRLGGIIWLIGGLLIAILSFIIPMEIFMGVFIACIAVMALVPIIFSYVKFKALNKDVHQS